MTRRAALRLALAAPLVACSRAPKEGATGEKGRVMSESRQSTSAMPAIFLAHGSPFLLDDPEWKAQLAAWAQALPRPRSILVVSAHWERSPITLGATTTVPLVYDFYGFPRRYYDVQYAAPGAPELAARVRELAGETVASSERGLDHGAYVPLVAMYPKADVPVLQMSIPTMDPKKLLAVGRKLAPLRDEGVLLMGSGFLTHNMRSIQFEPGSAPPSWATEFDAWAADALKRRDADALVEYRARAPGVREALPTHEHFVPVVVAMGASVDRGDAATFPIEGFTYGSFTKRSLQLG
jgi:4,5-DOPA dioxygenase extradiol